MALQPGLTIVSTPSRVTKSNGGGKSQSLYRWHPQLWAEVLTPLSQGFQSSLFLSQGLHASFLVAGRRTCAHPLHWVQSHPLCHREAVVPNLAFSRETTTKLLTADLRAHSCSDTVDWQQSPDFPVCVFQIRDSLLRERQFPGMHRFHSAPTQQSRGACT